MKFKSIGRKEDVSRLRKDKIKAVAIDLGFSGNNKTTGFASSTEPAGESLNFGDAVKKTVAFTKKHGDFVLILEAPLCGKFENGNPIARGKFEERSENPTPRHWNIGAGAAVALAAVHFLIQLQTSLAEAHVTVHLLEGFVSGHNKPKNSSSKSKKKIKEEQHGLDAALLLQSFSEAPIDDCFIKLDVSPDILSTTKILDPDSDFPPPLILKPKPSAS